MGICAGANAPGGIEHLPSNCQSRPLMCMADRKNSSPDLGQWEAVCCPRGQSRGVDLEEKGGEFSLPRLSAETKPTAGDWRDWRAELVVRAIFGIAQKFPVGEPGARWSVAIDKKTTSGEPSKVQDGARLVGVVPQPQELSIPAGLDRHMHLLPTWCWGFTLEAWWESPASLGVTRLISALAQRRPPSLGVFPSGGNDLDVRTL